MGNSLCKRLHALVRSQLDRYPGAWMVWCDPHGQWRKLLQRVAPDKRLGEFKLVPVEEELAGHAGGLKSRRDLQALIEAGESFVLYVPAKANDLGWLWAQALLAECIHERDLARQLEEWGWRSNNLQVLDGGELVARALENLDRDPAEWGGDTLTPDPDLLIRVLGGAAKPEDESKAKLDFTIEAAGLPAVPAEGLAVWRRKALAHLLVTEVALRAPGALPESHSLLVASEKRDFVRQVLDRWCDSLSLARLLPAAVLAADPLTGLSGLGGQVDAGQGPFRSQAAEQAVFANTCRRLALLTGRTLLDVLATLEPAIEAHAQDFWGRRTAGQSGHVPWGELGRLSAAARTLIEEAPSGQWASPEKAIAWYSGGGWQLDAAGEEITRTLESTAPELVGLIAPLRAAYRALWEESLIWWSETWSQAKCPLPAKMGTAGEWLRQALEASKRPTAVLVLDALRYDIAATLVERINQQEEVERARVEPARAALPTITALGMAMALPIESSRLVAELDSKGWSIHEKEKPANLSIAEERRKWWKQAETGVEFHTLKELHDGQTPKAGGACRRLVIHDATIDSMGHDEIDFQGSGAAVDRYLDAIEHLRNSEWKRILVVTDHGFIHWTSPDEKSVAHPVAEPAWASRRALAYAPEVALTGPQGLAPGAKWRIAFPSGATSFSAYGGLRYFHGGASLQEWIIPCLTIEWPVEARPVSVSIEPLPRIMSASQRVTLRVSGTSLLAEDNIARKIEVVARAAETHTILLRSGQEWARIESANPELYLEPEKDVEAARNTALRIEVRDAQTEEVLDSIESTLSIELSGW